MPHAEAFTGIGRSSGTPSPFEVVMPPGLVVGGVVLSDQVKSLDRRIRQIDVVEKALSDIVNQVLAKIAPLLSLRF
jgi:mRNA interferase MazF